MSGLGRTAPLALAEAAQLIGHAKASAETRAKVARVAEALEAALPRLEAQAQQIWKTSHPALGGGHAGR